MAVGVAVGVAVGMGVGVGMRVAVGVAGRVAGRVAVGVTSGEWDGPEWQATTNMLCTATTLAIDLKVPLHDSPPTSSAQNLLKCSTSTLGSLVTTCRTVWGADLAPQASQFFKTDSGCMEAARRSERRRGEGAEGSGTGTSRLGRWGMGCG